MRAFSVSEMWASRSSVARKASSSSVSESDDSESDPSSPSLYFSSTVDGC